MKKIPRKVVALLVATLFLATTHMVFSVGEAKAWNQLFESPLQITRIFYTNKDYWYIGDGVWVVLVQYCWADVNEATGEVYASECGPWENNGSSL